MNDAVVSSVFESSSPSGTGEGGGAGCWYVTRSLVSVTPSFPFANSSAKSTAPPDGTDCTKNLSLHPFRSAGQSRCACMMTCTTCVAPGATKPVFGLTQYFFGAVVFTLNASSTEPGLYRRIVVGICFLSSTVFGDDEMSFWDGLGWWVGQWGRGRGHLDLLTQRFWGRAYWDSFTAGSRTPPGTGTRPEGTGHPATLVHFSATHGGT